MSENLNITRRKWLHLNHFVDTIDWTRITQKILHVASPSSRISSSFLEQKKITQNTALKNTAYTSLDMEKNWKSIYRGVVHRSKNALVWTETRIKKIVKLRPHPQKIVDWRLDDQYICELQTELVNSLLELGLFNF